MAGSAWRCPTSIAPSVVTRRQPLWQLQLAVRSRADSHAAVSTVIWLHLGERVKILIVDDNAPIRRLIASIVGPLAKSIQECSSGGEAVAAYRSMRPDIVLMDIRMKEM